MAAQQRATTLIIVYNFLGVRIYARRTGWHPNAQSQRHDTVVFSALYLGSNFPCHGNDATPSGRGRPSRDVQVPQSARLELIHETVHPEVLPAFLPRILHGRSIGDVRDLGAHARLDNLCQRVGGGDALEIERAGEGGERREPARERGRRFRRGRARGDRFVTRHGTAAVCVTDDENCCARKTFSLLARSDGDRGGEGKKTRERRTVFDADYGDGKCDYRKHTVIVRMDLTR